MGKIIAANWKMQLKYQDSLALAKKIAKNIKKPEAEVIVFPEYLSLAAISQILKKSKIKLGAQDGAANFLGAYTGEVTALNIKAVGASYVLIGHSERRQIFGETSELINIKIKSALAVGLTAIVCVGENLAQKEKGETKKVLLSQLKGALAGLNSKTFIRPLKLIIAYEPIWAIGSGEAIMPAEANLIHTFLKKEIKKIIKQEVLIIYGGSVNLDNAKAFLNYPQIDGLLVGGASLKADVLQKIAQLKIK